MVFDEHTPKKKQIAYWRMKMKAAKRGMDLYPVGSDEREMYRAQYNEATKHYNELFEDLYRR